MTTTTRMPVKNQILWVFLFSLLLPHAWGKEKKTLANKLDELHIPDDKITPVLNRDQLYVVNTRYSSLNNRHELTLQGGHNFAAKNHLKSQQAALAYRYHLNSRWSLGLRYVRYSNSLTKAGDSLLTDQRLSPIPITHSIPRRSFSTTIPFTENFAGLQTG